MTPPPPRRPLWDMCVHGHGHRAWHFQCAGLGVGLWWFMWPRVQRGAAYGPGHWRTGSVRLRACQAVDHRSVSKQHEALVPLMFAPWVLAVRFL